MTSSVFSIITPCRNAASHIGQCLTSVAAQIPADGSSFSLEHLIIDGASTDATLAIVRDFAATHPHVRLISEPDRGQSDAMNKGIRLAQGDWIGFLNADDAYLPGALAEACATLQKLPAPAFLCGNCRVIDAFGKLLHHNRPRCLRLAALLAGAEPPWNPAAYFYHKSLHHTLGPYDEEDHFTMDLDFILRVAAHHRLTYIDRDWGLFRWAPGGKTFDAQHNQLMEQRKTAVLRQHLSRAPFFLRLAVPSLRTLHRLSHRIRSRLGNKSR